MTTQLEYKVTLELDQEMFDVLGAISRNQEGFVWVDIDSIDEEDTCPNCGQHVE